LFGAILANISKFTPEKRDVILDALHNHPSLGRAARKARITRHTLRNWRLANPEFAAEVEAAREAGFEVLEDALIVRGEKNDTTAAIFMLKGWKPERYQERKAVDMNLTGNLTIVMGERSDGPA
jgi:Rad3-related DNA helicase